MQFWNILLPYTMRKHVLRREHNYVNKNGKLLSPYVVIATAIGKGLIVWTLQMEIVWEPYFIIDKRGLFSFII